jgi:hypothetical protein
MATELADLAVAGTKRATASLALDYGSLAIQMDARVAIALYEKLGELGRKMGWLPQKEGENQP